MTSNLPAERPESILALTGAQASLFDDDPRRLLGLDDGEFAALVADVRQSGESVIVRIRQVVGLLAWAAWHRYDEKRYREFVADFAQRLGVESRVILDWRRKAARGLPMPPMAQARSLARKSAGQGPVNTSGRIIPAKSSEGVAPASETVPEPRVQAPSGKSSAGAVKDTTVTPSGSSDVAPAPADPPSGGAGIQPPPRPTGDPTSPLSAPPDLPERPPSDRQLAARVVSAMQDVDPSDAGPVLTPEEATFLRQWAQRTLDAWKAVYAPPAPAEKPQRRQGTITRPQAAVLAGRAIEQLNGTAGRPSARITQPDHTRLNYVTKLNASEGGRSKSHALDCSCLGCKAPKAVAK